jgi:hypothetical protein
MSKKQLLLESGSRTLSNNFMLLKKVTSSDKLYELLNSKKSIFFAHKMYPSAWVMSFQYRYVQTRLKAGLFWETIDMREANIENNKQLSDGCQLAHSREIMCPFEDQPCHSCGWHFPED